MSCFAKMTSFKEVLDPDVLVLEPNFELIGDDVIYAWRLF